ncbi:I78 family peptidase inhibitor [Acerihabitans arboris]|uniref:Peptidase inhibitor I78 family protein n=1 Tax=Acerihabitans arboris TaxID=2691583 RepID=A0A845SH50_9GAMM|nr:I78 family peptidase inhibitor [Acerihabitans arboris]NDL61951.1 hypothetical protein [Acerihabitans arboris]
MRNTVLLTFIILFTLAACRSAENHQSTHNAAQPLPVDDTCLATSFRNLIGKPDSVLDSMRFSVPMRLIRPGQPVTMDFNPKRVNFISDAQGVIINIRCS